MSSIPIFDTHAHLDSEDFAGDLDAVVWRIETGVFPDGFMPQEFEGKNLKIAGVLLPGIDLYSSRRCIEISKDSPQLHAAVAIHPNSLARMGTSDWRRIEVLAGMSEVVAIGETGLDRYWDRTPFDMQLDYFRRHLELSTRTGKPVLIHCRDAWNDLLPIIREREHWNGVIHAFSGTPEQAAVAIERGFSISFAGALTYRNAKFAPLWEAATIVPPERLLIETDSPYLTPHPFRGKLRRNEPSMAAIVALRLAELRGETLEFIAETTTRNAAAMFKTS